MCITNRTSNHLRITWVSLTISLIIYRTNLLKITIIDVYNHVTQLVAWYFGYFIHDLLYVDVDIHVHIDVIVCCIRVQSIILSVYVLIQPLHSYYVMSLPLSMCSATSTGTVCMENYCYFLCSVKSLIHV